MPLRLLHLEDNVRDAELIVALLSGAEFRFEVTRADSSQSFMEALEKHQFDLILCDYNLPSFDGGAALKLARKRHPDTPFIFVSGTIGEDRAIEALKDGATDYVLKQRMERLVPAVRRALREVEEISARKKVEKQLLRAQRMESIGALASGIAHDLNNVLGPIVLGTEVIRRHIQDPRCLKILDTMSLCAKRGAAVLNQVLRIASGDTDVKKLLQPRHVVEEVLGLIKETFPSSIKIVSEMGQDIPAVMADPTQLHQALLNLCVNARDAMPEDGELRIQVEKKEIGDSFVRLHVKAQQGIYVVISVSDTGVGIPQDIKDRIFEPFFTTKESGKGTGLGLSSVSSIVENHQGFFTLESQEGKGTTFSVYLPASESEGQEETESKQPIPDGNGEAILVVDDEESIREVSKELLETHGYKVIVAGNGAEALAVYMREKDDIKLVVTDLVMPILNGPETIRSLKRVNPEIKIIAATGTVFEAGAGVVAESDVIAMLRKPYSSDVLLQTIAEALGKSAHKTT